MSLGKARCRGPFAARIASTGPVRDAHPLADTLISLTLWTVAASIVAHGVTAQPLMQRYVSHRRRRRPAKPMPEGGAP